MWNFCSWSEYQRNCIFLDLEETFIAEVYKNCQSISACVGVMWMVFDLRRDPGQSCRHLFSLGRHLSSLAGPLRVIPFAHSQEKSSAKTKR